LVLAYYPQRSRQSLSTNSNSPPQGLAQIGQLNDPIKAIFPPIADATFQFYKFYQIKPNQAIGTQINMPVAIIDTLGAGILQEASGFDIRVFDSNGVPLEYDVEAVNTGTGEIIVWPNMTTVQDSEFIQLTFGKPSATDGSNPNAVYDINYKGVYHLNQTTFVSGSTIDSTVNANDGSPSGISVTSVTGKIGNAVRYDAESNIEFGSSLMSSMGLTGMVSVWGNVDDLAVGPAPAVPTFYSMRDGSNFWEAFFNTTISPKTMRIRYGDGNNLFEFEVPDSVVDSGETHSYTFTWDQPNSTVRVYIDGDLFAEQVSSWTAPASPLTSTAIGNRLAEAFITSLIGFEDEARFSNIIRTSDWIKTEFNNQNDNDAFWFKTPILENGLDNFLVDDIDRNIVAVQS